MKEVKDLEATELEDEKKLTQYSAEDGNTEPPTEDQLDKLSVLVRKRISFNLEGKQKKDGNVQVKVSPLLKKAGISQSSYLVFCGLNGGRDPALELLKKRVTKAEKDEMALTLNQAYAKIRELLPEAKLADLQYITKFVSEIEKTKAQLSDGVRVNIKNSNPNNVNSTKIDELLHQVSSEDDDEKIN